ncbi:hypothetical protein [Pontivivens nitratireducens]|uniref:hypothetical protein n=1 Tax=Pontivivens nitratireducens TaxID=2758038 RepID=UPI00163A9088|nr:hypothetical protein [Pontibrevibacter nitratireducens]
MSISKMLSAGAVGFLLLTSVAGCEVATGAAVGAGIGAVGAEATGNDVEDGAAVGGLVGAGIGAAN